MSLIKSKKIKDKKEYKTYYKLISIIFLFNQTAFAAHTDASGNEVASNAIQSIDETGSGYSGTFDSNNLSSTDSPYQLQQNSGSGNANAYSVVNPLTGGKLYSSEATYYLKNSISGDYSDEFSAENSDGVIHYYEGNSTTTSGKFSASGTGATLILYKNYTVNAEIDANNDSMVFVSSNHASGATISLDASTAYFDKNIATSSNFTIKNGSSVTMYGNDAGEVSVLNNASTVVIDSNYAAESTLINENGGVLTAINNNAPGTTIITNNANTILKNNVSTKNIMEVSNGGVLSGEGNDSSNSKITANNSTLNFKSNTVNDATITLSNKSQLTSNNDSVISTEINIDKTSSAYINEGIATKSTINNDGHLDLSNSSTSSATITNSGELSFSGNSGDSVNIVNEDAGKMYLKEGNSFTHSTLNNTGELFANGQQDVDGSTLNNTGIAYLTDTLLTGDSILNNSGYIYLLSSSVISSLTNSGNVILNSCSSCAGYTLTVDGNYVGNQGTLSIGTVLGGDDSLTDKLSISGSATGKTYVTVTNEGGTGAKTLEGIEVISTGSSTSDAFTQKGRIVAGSYEYHLQQGTASGANMNNWYLTSNEVYRPERGSYASNLQAAATMFNMRLEDRKGNGAYINPVTGARQESSLWVRSVGAHSEGRMSDGQSKYSANRMVFQIGNDILNGSLGIDDAWNLGIMGGYGKQYSSTLNNLSGYKSKGSVWGYSTGIYGTWYQNAKDKTGLYADSWLAWNWFNNSVKGDELSYEKYKSKGLTASLETGYTFHTGSYMTSGGMVNNVYVTPQAQVLWSGVKADDHTEANGTKVEGRGSDNIQTRLGVRLSMTGQSRLNKGTVRQFEPFVEANWVYTAKDYGVKMGDERSDIQGQRNVAELKTGVEGRVSENLSVWGSVAQQIGANSYQDTQGMLGVKYAF